MQNYKIHIIILHVYKTFTKNHCIIVWLDRTVRIGLFYIIATLLKQHHTTEVSLEEHSILLHWQLTTRVFS